MTPENSNGMVKFRILFSDITGNTGNVVTRTTDNSSVRFDKKIPRIFISVSPKIIWPDSSANMNDGAAIDTHFSEPSNITTDIIDHTGALVKNLYISNDSIKNPEPFEWNGTNNTGTFAPDGIYTIKVTAIDMAGNTDIDTSATIIKK